MSGLFCVCAREIASAIDASSKKLIDDTIFRYGLQESFKITDSEVIHIPTGGTIHFKGLKGGSKSETRTRLRSLEGVDVLWVEEAQSLSESTLTDIDETIRGLNTSGKSRKIIYSLNPYENPDAVFSFYESIPEVMKLECNICDNPFAPADRLVKSEALKIKDYALWLHVYGGKPLSIGDRCLISLQQYNEAVKRSWDRNEREIVAADIARFGDDLTVFGKRKGNALIDIKEYKGQDLITTAQMLMDYAKGAPVRVDDTGLGGGVTDYLRKQGYPVQPINFGNRAIRQDLYTDIISEMWFSLADKIDTISLPQHKDLQYQLVSRYYTYDKAGRRKAETKADYKKRCGNSPDHADMLIMLFYETTTKPVRLYI